MQKQPERERDSEKAKVRESEKVREQVSEQKLISCSKFFFRWNENLVREILLETIPKNKSIEDVDVDVVNVGCRSKLTSTVEKHFSEHKARAGTGSSPSPGSQAQP